MHITSTGGAILYDAPKQRTIAAALVEAVEREANLSEANLSGAIGPNKYLVSPLQMLRDQPGPIRAYKLVTAGLRSPIQLSHRLTYEIGSQIEELHANTDESIDCAAGINVASLDWCLREWWPGWRILIVEFTAADIAAIPITTDGKFRVFRCTVVGEKDLAELDWPPKLVEPEAATET